ncbi:sodium:proton antiporter [Cellulophaga sp. E16_2]|uniref:Sodium/proton antiporter, CPA1 family n=2 Tax=Flavobacteriaceae TaxID=49546 RepID=E6XEH5_CELAD|nr:sodium:proton antiporter [Cellulophaga sp. E16_2]ADV50265.1 sodium/proton antiporter, CPA1 family [Cellulophaga algicola DSM 14237]MBO0592668.1 sodium:proton antiporter [Cellulophaga sp. E16_2]
MDLFTIISILMVLVSIFAYLNSRFLKLQTTIGTMIISILFSLGVLGLSKLFPDLIKFEKDIVGTIDFKKLLMEGLLSFMLFAGAIHVNFNELKSQKWKIVAFSSFGVLLSTALVGGIFFWVLERIGMPLPLMHCLLFGALISPTDPISVMGILKKIGIKKSMETTIVGESLFNDGVGVVVFLTLLQFANAGNLDGIDPIGITKNFLIEIGGGLLFGYVLGRVTHRAISKINSYETEVLITLGMVMGGYALAGKVGVSGPISMVVAGLIIGNKTYRQEKKENTLDYVDKFWELIDILSNAVLFVLIGLEIVLIPFTGQLLIVGVLAAFVVVLSRFLSVGALVVLLKKWLPFDAKTSLIMTWGGLRGGISIAMALSLPKEVSWDNIVPITYLVVIFSIIVQGLTLEKVIVRLTK